MRKLDGFFVLKNHLLSILLALHLTLACSDNEFTSQNQNSQNSGESERRTRSPLSRQQQAINFLNTTNKWPKLTVGLAQLKRKDVPVVLVPNTQFPDIFFQVYRCARDITIEGTSETFDGNHPSMYSLDTTRDYFTRNRFWDSITERCSAVSALHPQGELLDLTAPSGDWMWFARACTHSNSDTTHECSPVLAFSDSLDGYRNAFSDAEYQLLKNINSKLQKIQNTTSNVSASTTDLFVALEQCNQAVWSRATRSIMKSVILNIIGLGSSIIFEIFGPTGNSDLPWKERISVIWQPTEDVQKSGQAITRILMWIFTSQHDFKETCTRAEETRINGMTDVLALKQLQIELATDLDRAEKFGIPLPSGLQK